MLHRAATSNVTGRRQPRAILPAWLPTFEGRHLPDALQLNADVESDGFRDPIRSDRTRCPVSGLEDADQQSYSCEGGDSARAPHYDGPVFLAGFTYQKTRADTDKM